MTRDEQIEHINKIIDMLKVEREMPGETDIVFDMTTWYSSSGCGTAMCIGGHSDYITSVIEGAGQFKFSNEEEVADRFGLTMEDYRDLCYSERQENPSLTRINKQACPHTTAIRALEYVRDTGTFPGWAQFMDDAQ